MNKKDLERSDQERSDSSKAVALFQVGGWYQQQDGEWVQFVGVENEGTHYECMYSIDPIDGHRIHRYTTRDFGRVTGTDHEYGDPRNTPPTYPESALHAAEAELGELRRMVGEVVKDDAWAMRMAHELTAAGYGMMLSALTSKEKPDA